MEDVKLPKAPQPRATIFEAHGMWDAGDYFDRAQMDAHGASCYEAGMKKAAPDSATWPDARNRGLLQAAKQAFSALKRWRLQMGPNHMIYEAMQHLEPAIEREEAWRAAIKNDSPIKQTPYGPAILLDDVRDAERYRWLRDQHNGVDPNLRASYDDSIDAAMQKE